MISKYNMILIIFQLNLIILRYQINQIQSLITSYKNNHNLKVKNKILIKLIKKEILIN